MGKKRKFVDAAPDDTQDLREGEPAVEGEPANQRLSTKSIKRVLPPRAAKVSDAVSDSSSQTGPVEERSTSITIRRPLDPTPALHTLPLDESFCPSGFNMLDILMKVATRPKPVIDIGAVDFSCAFCVCDVTLPDLPIVYCSEGFEKLTGYTEAEIMGQNCRFLQTPGGKMKSGRPKHDANSKILQDLRRDKGRHALSESGNHDTCRGGFSRYQVLRWFSSRSGDTGSLEQDLSFDLRYNNGSSSCSIKIAHTVISAFGEDKGLVQAMLRNEPFLLHGLLLKHPARGYPKQQHKSQNVGVSLETLPSFGPFRRGMELLTLILAKARWQSALQNRDLYCESIDELYRSVVLTYEQLYRSIGPGHLPLTPECRKLIQILVLVRRYHWTQFKLSWSTLRSYASLKLLIPEDNSLFIYFNADGNQDFQTDLEDIRTGIVDDPIVGIRRTPFMTPRHSSPHE